MTTLLQCGHGVYTIAITPVVWYHADCVDGFTAAWVAYKANPAVQAAPVRYGEPPPLHQYAGRLALDPKSWLMILDFSYPRDVLVGLQEIAAKVTVLDHHKTAEADLQGFPGCQFDMNRSGARMAWDFLFEGQEPPWVVSYVEDRDLWRFALPHSKEVNALIRSTEQTWEAWDALSALSVEEAALRGVGCLAHIDAYVRAALKHAFWATLEGVRLPLVNITYEGCSEVADALCRQWKNPVAGYYFEQGSGRYQYGLRSRDGYDCSALARHYGGGGHAAASGFVVDRPVHVRVR